MSVWYFGRLTAVLTVTSMLMAGAVRAEVPPPPMCEQLQLLVAPSAGDAGLRWAETLARQSGLQLHVQQPAGDALESFAAGVQDLWLGSSLEVLQQTAAHPLQPPLWQDVYWLWFRAGELTSLQQLPELSGLRGAYWTGQLEQGQLAVLAPHVGLDDLRAQAGPAEALQALLDGEVDFFLAARDTLTDLPGTEALEALTKPLLVRPYYLALSNNSACNDQALTSVLEAAINAALLEKH